MIIIGAGMAGLLAAAILRHDASSILEAQQSLPNNHSALLRFRSSIVGDALNIPFKEVPVMKAVAGNLNPVAAMLAYSRKTNGTATMRSSISATGEIVHRWIAPEDLIQQMADRVSCPIRLSTPADFSGMNGHGEKVISTIPMPILMKALGWVAPEFKSVSGYNITAWLSDVDAYATVYIPNPEYLANRVSLTGNKLTIEYARPHELPSAVEMAVAEMVASQDYLRNEVRAHLSKHFGLAGILIKGVQIKVQPYAKILPIDENLRRNFIIWASEKFGIYSLGRFATWRPGLLLDDLVQDIRVIERLARSSETSYDHRKKEH